MNQNIKKIPNHVGIIMDGNSRWAESNKLDKYFGHRKGVEAAKIAVNAALDSRIKHLSLYAFSTENWNRPIDEIEWLIGLLRIYLKSEKKHLIQNGIQLHIIGSLTALPSSLVQEIEGIIEATSNNIRMHLYIAFSYGGRQEIVDACKKFAHSDMSLEELSVDNFNKFLYAPSMPELDFVIRTGGMCRISNFLLWHIAYAELYFIDKYWPDFSQNDFMNAIEYFGDAKRTFGKR